MENRPFRLIALVLIGLAAMVSCECSTTRESPPAPESTRNNDNIQAQKDFLERERESIDAYIKDRDLKVTRTGTGLYYEILVDSAFGEPAATGDIVEYEYDIYLMNGSLLYSSEEDGPKSLKVDKEDAELGVHESLKLLGVGDKGLFILPSHLAFGVGGDQYRVPPKTPLVYELKINNINKSKS